MKITVRRSGNLGRALLGAVAALALVVPANAGAQQITQSPPEQRDGLWNGVLIGAAVGAVIGMAVAPPAFCGRNDSECATIVRVAIGLPSIGAGIAVGVIVDALHQDRSAGVVSSGRRTGAIFRVRF